MGNGRKIGQWTYEFEYSAVEINQPKEQEDT